VETLVVLGTACVLGFLHALEIDHMLAVTTFVTRRPRLAAAAGFGARWGLGHSIAVLLAGGLLLATGLKLPARFDTAGEAVVGLMLVGLGLWAWRSAARLHLHTPEEHGGHAHVHAHDATADAHAHAHEPAHAHAHPHPHEHAHGHAHHEAPAHHHHHHHDHPHPHPHAHAGHEHGGITLVGLMHGLAGTSAVVALVPVTMLQSLPVGLGYLVMFGVGVTAAMTLFAMAAAYAMRQAAERSLIWGRRAARIVGTTGIVVGAWWVLRAAGVIG
jgi:ABC-type nickel/cobalt efflux system permease component RcnA